MVYDGVSYFLDVSHILKKSLTKMKQTIETTPKPINIKVKNGYFLKEFASIKFERTF